jgi:hypothetical protein
MSAAEILTVISDLDIFAHKPIQTSILETVETVYKPIAPVEQSDLEFLIPADSDTYIDLDIKLYMRSKLVSGEGKDLDNKDFTAVTNNFLHSLFSQCNITLNNVPITQSGDLYQYRSYLETILSYGSGAGASHLTKLVLVSRPGRYVAL